MAKVSKRQDAVNLRNPGADELSRLIVLVFQLDGALTAAGDALARPAGQTSARWRVLAAVEQQPLTVAQVARAWGLARQSVQRVADALEQDGLAAYDDNPLDRRAKLLRLTPAGKRTLGRIQRVQRSWAEELAGRLGVADLRSASDTLIRVLAALDEGAAREGRDRPRGPV